jgi:hypothetical protein
MDRKSEGIFTWMPILFSFSRFRDNAVEPTPEKNAFSNPNDYCRNHLFLN